MTKKQRQLSGEQIVFVCLFSGYHAEATGNPYVKKELWFLSHTVYKIDTQLIIALKVKAKTI